MYVSILCKNKYQNEDFLSYLKDNINVLNSYIIMASLEYSIDNKLISANILC